MESLDRSSFLGGIGALAVGSRGLGRTAAAQSLLSAPLAELQRELSGTVVEDSLIRARHRVHEASSSRLSRPVAAIHAIHLQYDTMIKRDKVAEHILAKEREALTIQERELVAHAATPAE